MRTEVQNACTVVAITSAAVLLVDPTKTAGAAAAVKTALALAAVVAFTKTAAITAMRAALRAMAVRFGPMSHHR